MEIQSVRCECCSLKEDCTEEYIHEVRAGFQGKWLCGLCAEAARDELSRGRKKGYSLEDAIKAHMSFCRKFNCNPAVQVADGMRQMLRRRSGDLSVAAASGLSKKKYGRMMSTSQVGDDSLISLY